MCSLFYVSLSHTTNLTLGGLKQDVDVRLVQCQPTIYKRRITATLGRLASRGEQRMKVEVRFLRQKVMLMIS